MILPLHDPWKGDMVASRVLSTLRSVQSALAARRGADWIRLADHALVRRGFWVETTSTPGAPSLIVEGRLYVEVPAGDTLSASAGFVTRLKRSGCAAGLWIRPGASDPVASAHYQKNPDWAPQGVWSRLRSDCRRWSAPAMPAPAG